MENNGSVWNKWDLHLHTPTTKLSDNFQKNGEEVIWKTYCDKIENSDVVAFGITDYFSCENYFTFLNEFNKYYPASKKVFFPNIEFRLDISVNQQAEEINIHVIFSNELTKTEIDDFLVSLKTNHSSSSGNKISCKNLLPEQFVSATVNHNNLINSLKDCFGQNKQYLVIAAANNAGLRPVNSSPRKLAITDEIDRVCDGFFGGRQNIKYYLRTDRYETEDIAKSSPVLCGCDAHSFEDIDQHLGKFVTRTNEAGKLEIYKDITWIKADRTFEGLKQVKYEPQHRVLITENKPRKPVRRIESIKFNFPANTFIQRKNSTVQQEFCLKNLKQQIFFSDYFTCIIGGRGTGKSTIINLLAEKLNEKTDYFNKSNLKINGVNYDIEGDKDNYIEITGTNEIEFVSQGKIEKLAEGNELTKLIFKERIKEIESEFIQIETDYENINSKIDENIAILFKLIANARIKETKNKEKLTIQKIIDSINDERYISITNNIKAFKQELTGIENSKNNYMLILNELRTLSLNYSTVGIVPNDVDTRISEIINTVNGLEEFSITEDEITVSPKEFYEVNNRIDEINSSLVEESQKLRTFFQEKGTNEETIKDSQKASEALSKIASDLENIEIQDNRYKLAYGQNNEVINTISNLYDRNDTLIGVNLSSINEKLKIDDENVLDINFTYEFDNEIFKNELFREFYNTFNEYHIRGTSEDRVKEILFLIEPDFELLKLKFSSFNERLSNILTENNYRTENNFVKIITEIFSNNGNYLVYLNLVKKHRYNLSKYIKINGFYGKRELESCSFGQRCTAVIVTLLMTGVKPLIIDEPEAHLDNKLVADYLVGLVKEKQFDRQIIFASHNSNFVINGDSSLIHHLEIPANSIYTQITSTTIENIDNREKLLKLEGGREAFLNRESKYGM